MNDLHSELDAQIAELEALQADSKTVREILANIGESDPIGRLSFGARLVDIESQIKRLTTAIVDENALAEKIEGEERE